MNKAAFTALYLLFSLAPIALAGAASTSANSLLSPSATNTPVPTPTPYSIAEVQRDIWIEIGLSIVILGVIAACALIIRGHPNVVDQK
jgi:hypothetical protein